MASQVPNGRVIRAFKAHNVKAFAAATFYTKVWLTADGLWTRRFDEAGRWPEAEALAIAGQVNDEGYEAVQVVVI